MATTRTLKLRVIYHPEYKGGVYMLNYKVGHHWWNLEYSKSISYIKRVIKKKSKECHIILLTKDWCV